MKLAINGGTPVRTQPFPNQACIGPNEMNAAQRVIQSQMLSGYRGNWDGYKGGKEIQEFEAAWSKKFGNEHSIAVNSCTSALHIACMAIGLKPGDEVIVTPWSMTCSATAPMLCGAIPVFADIEPDYFCLDVGSVRSKITERTKAIIAVDLFGQPCNPKLRELADKHGLVLIEDAAQAPGAEYKVDEIKLKQRQGGDTQFINKYTGTIGHIGCFSFTQGKHMTAGEGGMIVTDNDDLALRCRLIMNHAEAIINDLNDLGGNYEITSSLWGFNMRMTEIQAAILKEQLGRLDGFIKTRQSNASWMDLCLCNSGYGLPFKPAPIRADCTHTHYVQAFLYDQEKAEGIHRDTFINAVKAELQPMEGRESEGVRMGCGYIKPIYRMPLFADHFLDTPPTDILNSPEMKTRLWNEQLVKYTPLPNVERLWKDELFLHLYLARPTSIADLNDIVDAFIKVWENREELR